MTVIGDAYIEVKADTDKFTKDVHSNVGTVAKQAAGLIAGAFAAVQVKDFLGDAIAEGREALKVQRQTEAVLKSTGGQANVTSDQIGALAQRLSGLAGVDDELIQSSENVLLTFTKVRNEAGAGNDIFNQTTQAALDMSAALGTDLQGATLQLGKALNDPVKGITALSRAGVSFTKQQKDQIKALVESGHTLQAQKLILAEFNTEFGGAAAAAADPLQKLGVVVGNLKERVGLALLPVITQAADLLSKYLPTALDLAGKGFDYVARVAGDLYVKAQPVVDVIQQIGDIFRRVFAGEDVPDASGWVGTVTQIAEAAKQLASFIGDNLRPILIGLGITIAAMVAPLATAAAGFIYLYTQVDGFRAVIDATVKFIATTVVPAIGTVVQGVIDQFTHLRDFTQQNWDAISEAVGHVLVAIKVAVGAVLAPIVLAWKLWGDQILAVVRIAWDQIKLVIDTAVRVVRDVILVVLNLINGDWGKAWNALKDIPAAMFSYAIGTIRNALGVVRQLISGALEALGAIWSAGWHALAGIAETAFQATLSFVAGIPARILGALGDLGNLLLHVGQDIVGGLLQGISNTWHKVTDKIHDLISKIPGPVRRLLGISSPSRVFFEIGQYTIEGLVQGVTSKQTKAQKAATDLAKKMADATKAALQDAFGSIGDLFGGLGVINGRAQAQRNLTNAQNALDLVRGRSNELPTLIAQARAKVATETAKAKAQTPEELRDIASAEDAVTAATQAHADAVAELARLQSGQPTTDEIVAQLQAQQKAADAAKAAAAAPGDALLAAQAQQAQEALTRATDDATVSNRELSDAARAVYLTDLDVQVATTQLTDKRTASTAATAEQTQAEADLKDLLEEQAQVTRDLKAATDTLNDARVAAVQAEVAYVEQQQKLKDLAPGTIEFFKELAKQAGLSDAQIANLVGSLDKLRQGVGSNVLAPGGGSALINTVTGRQAYTGPQGEAGSASKATIEAYAKSKGISVPVQSFTIGGVTSYYLPGVAIDPGNVAALAGISGRASGGPTVGGKWYMVGENGPELFRAGQSGHITDAARTAALLGGSSRPVAEFHEGAVQVGVMDTSLILAQLNVRAAIGTALADATRLAPVVGS